MSILFEHPGGVVPEKIVPSCHNFRDHSVHPMVTGFKEIDATTLFVLHKKLGLITLGVAVVISASACKNASKNVGEVQDDNEPKTMDEKANKTDATKEVAKIRLKGDFNEAVNAKWLESTELPADKVLLGGLVGLDADVKKLLSKDMEKMAAEGRSKADNELGNMVEFYKLAADREKLNKQGYEAIKADIAKIKSIKSLADFAKILEQPVPLDNLLSFVQ
ncbi:hypothetical protein BC351_14635 [Paenibacillus ferrarius]|uniref:Peptidase M13 N-terminal domain-containing protein n=1 Tax=Paenibacillus ferrarius TaxID=1469647 RepID=A0A1V4H751_9BACL|nr:hypothetical protein [Paenibacillus ferrarius]OPH46715.1 hypothetical protein BC351_14635 [Paenibacillus ferrarius]